MVAVLQQVGSGRIIAIDRAVVLVGRSADCDVVIAASQKISRRHCCLVQVDDTYFLRDLGSMNGVWLNGDRVNREARMSPGDRVAIGDVEFLFHPNARVEQRKSGSAPANRHAAPSGNGSDAPAMAPAEVMVEPMIGDELVEVEILQDVDNGFEILDDVIPLGDDGLPLLGTNEYEIPDEPIIKPDDDGFDDDLIAYDTD